MQWYKPLHWVAPHVGAWIEMVSPIWYFVRIVAPHVGAWIEISMDSNMYPVGLVAPHVGAWIEILQ